MNALSWGLMAGLSCSSSSVVGGKEEGSRGFYSRRRKLHGKEMGEISWEEKGGTTVRGGEGSIV